jgi:hypothetical protein
MFFGFCDEIAAVDPPIWSQLVDFLTYSNPGSLGQNFQGKKKKMIPSLF